jgi:hypothetical protein
MSVNIYGGVIFPSKGQNEKCANTNRISIIDLTQAVKESKSVSERLLFNAKSVIFQQEQVTYWWDDVRFVTIIL